MDEFRLILKQSTLQLNLTYEEVIEDKLSDWCDQNNVHYDAESLTGTWSGRNTTFLFEWTYKSNPNGDGGILTQQIRMPSRVIWRNLLERALIPIIFIITYFFQSINIPEVRDAPLANIDVITKAILLLLLILGVGVWIIYQQYQQLDWVTVPDPLVDGQNMGGEFNTYAPYNSDSLFMIMAFVFATFAILIGDQSFTLFLGTVTTGLVFIYNIGYYLDGGETYITFVSDIIGNKIGLSNTPRQFLKASFNFSYLMIAIVSVIVFIPLVYEILLADVENYYEFLSNVPVSIPYIDLFFAAILGYYIFSQIRNIGDESRIISYNLFQSYEYSKANRVVDAVSILLGTTILYSSIFIGIWVLTGFLLVDIPLNTFGFQKSLTVISISLLYFPIGICFQFMTMHSHKKDLLAKSVEEEISIEGYNETYRLLNNYSEFACSLSTFRSDHVIISRGMKRVLSDDKELLAVIAHEQAHIKYRDNMLLRITAYLSVFLLCGKNVLYTLIDFERRELRADSHAASKVGKDRIESALKTLKEEVDPSLSYESYGPNFAPQMYPQKKDQGITRIFDLFFGDFAIANSHSSFDKRISELETDEES